MIHEEICTYEVCKLAKEKGFPQDVFGTCEMKSACYLEDGRYCKDGCIYPIEDAYTAPTQSLLQRWLREEKKIIVEVSAFPNEKKEFVFDWVVLWNPLYMADSDIVDSDAYSNGDNYSTYELALEDALKYALENLV